METWAAANEEPGRLRDGGDAGRWLAHEERRERMLAPFAGYQLTAAAVGRGLRPGGRQVFVCWQNLAGNQWIVVPGAAAARTWRRQPPVIRPLRDRSRWAIVAGVPPCCVPRCSATSPSSIVASDVRQSTHTASHPERVSPDAPALAGCPACGHGHA